MLHSVAYLVILRLLYEVVSLSLCVVRLAGYNSAIITGRWQLDVLPVRALIADEQ